MLATSRRAIAQRGGGGGGIGGGGGGTAGAGRPSGVAERDDLKSFHRAMVLQATAQQSALFTSAVQNAEAASAQLHAFRETLKACNCALTASAFCTALVNNALCWAVACRTMAR